METEKETEEETKEEETKKPLMRAIETPAVIATGFGVASAKGFLVLSFVFTPPEDTRVVRVLSRIVVMPPVAEDLIEALNEALEKMRKAEKKEK